MVVARAGVTARGNRTRRTGQLIRTHSREPVHVRIVGVPARASLGVIESGPPHFGLVTAVP